ncbi:DJ-1/PfpI family protein [Konateibacter massiliensis]|uniref:DJ-1/PfpI family protein n=1 Tax=Konateibacter massiliensis TaxID=2002841 RepID=UPI000C15BD1F|nr:DJ-1/PfpI family protein [Konateibacter massiliensis]
MNVLLLCLSGFETMEFSVFVDVMGWARDEMNCDINVTTCGFEKTVKSTFGISIVMDTTINEICVDDYDALAIPGGFQEYGFRDEAFHESTCKLIIKFNEQNKPIASVCVAAFALAKSGILKGKRATTYHLMDGLRQRELARYEGITVINQPVVVDGNIITSSCPETAIKVALKLLKMLTSEKMAQSIGEMMGYGQLFQIETMAKEGK